MSKTLPEQLAEANAALATAQGELATAKQTIATLTTAKDTAEAKAKELQGKLDAAATDKVALDAKLAEAATAAKAKDDEINKLKGEAKDANARATELAAKVGVPAVKGEDKGNDGAPAGGAKTMTLAAYDALTAQAKMDFCKAGGRITG